MNRTIFHFVQTRTQSDSQFLALTRSLRWIVVQVAWLAFSPVLFVKDPCDRQTTSRRSSTHLRSREYECVTILQFVCVLKSHISLKARAGIPPSTDLQQPLYFYRMDYLFAETSRPNTTYLQVSLQPQHTSSTQNNLFGLRVSLLFYLTAVRREKTKPVMWATLQQITLEHS